MILTILIGMGGVAVAGSWIAGRWNLHRDEALVLVDHRFERLVLAVQDGVGQAGIVVGIVVTSVLAWALVTDRDD